AYHLASVRDVLKHRERVLSGALKLGAIPSIAPYLLSVALPELQRRSPKLTLHLRETTTETLVRELVSGDLDLILVALPSRVTRPLPAIRRCPFADW
ncbi:MAG: LysR substrate-binding domain-containing protein, partial [Methyloceanibacter sp.]